MPLGGLPCFINGLAESTGKNTKRSKAGIYWFEHLMRGVAYHRYHLMPNGCAVCAVIHVLCDYNLTDGASGGQKVTRKEGVTVAGILVRGFTQQDLEKKMKAPAENADGALNLVELWDPTMEANPWEPVALDPGSVGIAGAFWV